MKRGQNLTLGTVGMIVLVLIVVTILALVFRDFITGGSHQLRNMSETAKFDPDKCANVFLGRACYESCDQPGLASVPGSFADCRDEGLVCCERT